MVMKEPIGIPDAYITIVVLNAVIVLAMLINVFAQIVGE